MLFWGSSDSDNEPIELTSDFVIVTPDGDYYEADSPEDAVDGCVVLRRDVMQDGDLEEIWEKQE